MEAGRELDALIAEKVMGWKRMRWCDWQHHDTRKDFTYSWHDAAGDMTKLAEDCDDFYSPEPAWSPSTNIADAWEVVERFVSEGVVFIVKGDGLRTGDFNPKWTVLVDNQPRTDADTAPLAICLAALKAKEVTHE